MRPNGSFMLRGRMDVSVMFHSFMKISSMLFGRHSRWEILRRFSIFDQRTSGIRKNCFTNVFLWTIQTYEIFWLIWAQYQNVKLGRYNLGKKESVDLRIICLNRNNVDENSEWMFEFALMDQTSSFALHFTEKYFERFSGCRKSYGNSSSW